MIKLFEKINFNIDENIRKREIRILNIPIIQYEKNKKFFKLFPKPFENQTINKISKFIPEGHDHVWIIISNGIGEANLLNFMIEELLNKYNCKNPCIVSEKSEYKQLYSLYSNIPFYNLKMKYYEYAFYLKHKDIKFNNKTYHLFHCSIDHANHRRKELERGNNIKHAVDDYLEYSGIKFIKNKHPKFSNEIKNSTLNKVNALNLNLNKFVILVPESNGTKNLDEIYWKTMVHDLYKKGYDVYINKKNGICDYAKCCLLNFGEASFLASKAKAIIGIRCGFLEILAAANQDIKIFALYNIFLDKISVNNFIQGFTLKNYPFYNKNIFEYDLSKKSVTEMFNEIITLL